MSVLESLLSNMSSEGILAIHLRKFFNSLSQVKPKEQGTDHCFRLPVPCLGTGSKLDLLFHRCCHFYTGHPSLPVTGAPSLCCLDSLFSLRIGVDRRELLLCFACGRRGFCAHRGSEALKWEGCLGASRWRRGKDPDPSAFVSRCLE